MLLKIDVHAENEYKYGRIKGVENILNYSRGINDWKDKNNTLVK